MIDNRHLFFQYPVKSFQKSIDREKKTKLDLLDYRIFRLEIFNVQSIDCHVHCRWRQLTILIHWWKPSKCDILRLALDISDTPDENSFDVLGKKDVYPRIFFNYFSFYSTKNCHLKIFALLFILNNNNIIITRKQIYAAVIRSVDNDVYICSLANDDHMFCFLPFAIELFFFISIGQLISSVD